MFPSSCWVSPKSFGIWAHFPQQAWWRSSISCGFGNRALLLVGFCTICHLREGEMDIPKPRRYHIVQGSSANLSHASQNRRRLFWRKLAGMEAGHSRCFNGWLASRFKGFFSCKWLGSCSGHQRMNRWKGTWHYARHPAWNWSLALGLAYRNVWSLRL